MTTGPCVAPALPQTKSLALHSTSASWTLATKVSDSHLSVSDHDFLSFQLFLSPYVTLYFLLNVTTTSSAWFLPCFYQNISGTSSLWARPWTLWIISLKWSLIEPESWTASHPPPYASAGAGTSTVTQGHTIRKQPPTWGWFFSGHHLEITNNFYLCISVLQLKSDGTVKYVSGGWSLCSWTPCCHPLTSQGQAPTCLFLSHCPTTTVALHPWWVLDGEWANAPCTLNMGWDSGGLGGYPQVSWTQREHHNLNQPIKKYDNRSIERPWKKRLISCFSNEGFHIFISPQVPANEAASPGLSFPAEGVRLVESRHLYTEPSWLLLFAGNGSHTAVSNCSNVC